MSNLGQFDVTKNGRFLIPVELLNRTSDPMTVVIDWPASLEK